MMTSHERIQRAFEHQDGDRVPILDTLWPATLENWHRQGLPSDVPWWQYFDVDQVAEIRVDNSPRYPKQVIEEAEDYTISTSEWGVTMKNWKHAGGVPEFLDFTITSPDRWQQAKARMQASEDRVDWQRLRTDYPQWKKNGQWIQGLFWFGFDVTHSWAVGTERVLMAMVENPEWCQDMFGHFLEIDLLLFQRILDAGYEMDSIFWYDDMGYKLNQFFSVNTYRQLLKPFHKKAADWAHSKGLKVHMHSCGDIRPFVPDMIDLGVDCLNPLEVKAGVDPLALKRDYGQSLAFHGGIDALLWNDKERIIDAIQRVVPTMKQGGGYIFSTDHSVPSTVSLDDYRQIIETVKQSGSF